jgi:hypothetical protein
LFGFVVSAVSAVECFHFAAYCMAALVDPAGFPLTQSKNLKFYPTDVRGRYQRVFPAETLTRVMTSTLAAPECDQLTKLRNVLAHRGTPPRMTFFSTTGANTPSAIPSNLEGLASQWRYDLQLLPLCLDPYRAWLEGSVQELVVHAAAFSARRL